MDAPGIVTTCAACAAPLPHNAPRCVRCKLRYCDSTCQHDHWRRGDKQMCKKIHRGGNAEQYNADKKYKEAVAVAVDSDSATCMGEYFFTGTDSSVTKVEYTFGYKKDAEGNLKIVVHHSSLPYGS